MKRTLFYWMASENWCVTPLDLGSQFHTEKMDHMAADRVRGSNICDKLQLGPSSWSWFIDPAWNGVEWVNSNFIGSAPMALHETVAVIQEVPKMNAMP